LLPALRLLPGALWLLLRLGEDRTLLRLLSLLLSRLLLLLSTLGWRLITLLLWLLNTLLVLRLVLLNTLLLLWLLRALLFL